MMITASLRRGIAAAVLLPSLASLPARGEQPRLEVTEVFVGGTDDINTYRIPSLICTRDGTVLAFCEGRKNSYRDGSPTHLVLKRSLGNAGPWIPRKPEGPAFSRSREQNMTWQPIQILIASTAGEAYMNPVPVIDRSSGSIHLLVNRHRNYDPSGSDAQVFLLTSSDEGATWTRPVDLTPATEAKELGPGIGIQMKSGRLVVPTYDGVIYSEDHGRTWKAGGKAPGPVDESQVVELADGSLMRNARSSPQRMIMISPDGGTTWGEARRDPALTDSELWGGCQASLVRYSRAGDGHTRNRLLFANPADLKYRQNLTVRMSYDEGQTWPLAKAITPGGAAYSSLTVFPDGSVGLIFETGNIYGDPTEYYAQLAFARFNLTWLTDGKDQGIGRSQ